jgi:hypothetical protein
VLQQKVELDKEAARLEQQNEVLRQAVYAATSGMRVTDEVLADDSNPLLIVNNRLQQFLGVDASNRPGPASGPVRRLLTVREAQTP